MLTTAGAERAALNYEFSPFLLRNPEARERLAAQREQMTRWLTDYITTNVPRLGGELPMPAETIARLLIASNEGIVMSGPVGAFFDMINSWPMAVCALIVGSRGNPSTGKYRRNTRIGTHSGADLTWH